MINAYPKFNPTSPCPKCGSRGVGATYHAPCADQPGCRTDKHRERIERNCRRCGYKWDQAPLDVDEGDKRP